MQNLNKLGKIILKAATRDNGRQNLIVMLGSDLLPVDGMMFLENKEVGSTTAMERNVLDESLKKKNEARLNGLVQAVAAELGSCSDGMRNLLAHVLDLSKTYKVVMVEQVSYRLDMSEMTYVVDFLKKEFPDTAFIHTTGNDLVRRNSTNSEILYVTDNDWVFYDCTEFGNHFSVTMDVPKMASGLDVLLNHSMNDLWTEEDEKKYKAIVLENMPNTKKLLYETIKKNREECLK